MATATLTTTALTPQQRRLLRYLARGIDHDTAARRLGISSRTLRRRMASICDRAGVRTTMEAVVWAAKRDLV